MNTSMAATPTVTWREPDTVQRLPQRPFNEILQTEAAIYLMHKRAAEASTGLPKGDLQFLAVRRDRPPVPPELLIELENGERVEYPPHSAPSPANASLKPPTTLNPCECTTALFDAWLRTVVQSIPAPEEVAGATQREDHSLPGTSNGRRKFGGVTGVSREQALYTALGLLETAARLLQRRTVLCRDQARLLHVYYDALEEDIHQHATARSTSIAAKNFVDSTTSTQPQQLLPPEHHKFSPFHYHMRMYKRAAPLQHYTEEQKKLQSRLEKVYYVLLKLEEVEGVSNSVLGEGQATSLLSQQQHQSTEDLCGGSTKVGSTARTNLRKDGLGIGRSENSSGALTLTSGSSAHGYGESKSPMNELTSQPSRRLAGMERRVRHLRRNLQLPLPASEVTSRLRNELILSFSARVLALREPAPFTYEIYVTAITTAASSWSSHVTLRSPGDTTHQQQSSHSISAFVEWYVQRVMDPLAISQLLSIVPREHVVTTTCRLVYACEAHASLRSSRALPDLGPVLLRAVAEGRADAVAQLLLSSSVSYGTVLSHPVDCHTCFFAGLLGGQLDVLTRLVEQQSWHVNALHTLLFMSAPWSTAAAPTATMVSRGCYTYQRALMERIQAFLCVAERALAARCQALTHVPPHSLERNAMNPESISTIAGGSDYEADKCALAALHRAQLLDMNAEGEKLLATLGRLSSAVSSASTHTSTTVTSGTTIAREVRTKSMEEGANGADDDDDDGGETTGSTSVSTVGALSMSFASRAAAAPPPVFLNGTLHSLRLFLALRNATLQYERQQQDLRWSALLGNVKPSTTGVGGGDAQSAAISATDGFGGSGNSMTWLHTSSPQQLQDAAVTNGRTDHGEAPFSSAVMTSSSFAHVLQQHQLDAITATAVCPLRCQMCPAFTTPQLQRVDAWSYGPLQSTTAITTALSTARDTSNEGGAKLSAEELVPLASQAKALIEIGGDDRRCDERLRDRLNRSPSPPPLRSRPIAALLMRSDTAIDMTASSWHAYPAVGQATFVGAHEHHGSGNSSALKRDARSANKPKAGIRTTHETRLHRLVSPWQSCGVTGVISSLQFRYSLSMPLEEVRRAAQDAKQRRALRTLYGSSAVEASDKSISDDDDGDGSVDHHHQLSDDGAAAAERASLSARTAPTPSTKPSFYYEVQLSVKYLVALYAADYVGATSPTIDSKAVEHGASGPLSEDAAYRLCENCVVVGLCDSITAAQANGCTRGPSHSYLVSHLGHKCGAGSMAKDMEKGGNGDDSDLAAAVGSNSTDGSGAWSAGVSVSVIAHEAVMATDQASTAPSDDDVGMDVLYLGLWKHQQNSVRAITAMQVPHHHVDEDAAGPCVNAAPVYLRLELPRWRRPAAAASTNVWLPTITQACRDDVAIALAKTHQQRQQAAAAQIAAANEASKHAKTAPSGETAPPPPSPSLLSFPRGCSQVSATLVLGLLLDPSADTLRLRLNNYTDFEEITLGLRLSSAAEASAVTTSALPLLLYPAATLSLNDGGWRSWCDHQTREWAKLQQQEAQQSGLTTGEGRGESPQALHSALSSSSPLFVSNAVLRFNFDVAELLFGPPPPHQAVMVTSTDAIVSATGAPHMSKQRRVREPIGALAPQSAAPRSQAYQPIALLDSSVKFTQMLSVLTDVSLRAAAKKGTDKNRQQPELTSLYHDDGAAAVDEEDEVDNAGAMSRGAAPPAHSPVLLTGSRDRRARAALMQVQSLLNTPAGGAAITSADSSSAFNKSEPVDLFYPPVRIYRHSCHCPPHELYPLSSSSSDATDGDDAEVRSRCAQQQQQQQQRRRSRRNRRIGLGGASETPSFQMANVYWHDIIPENARLTPLCAALASRQRTMAYVIATHPLTCFCGLRAGEEDAGAALMQQQQQQSQQRRTALYTACALGYMEVVQVLLERVPVEELLLYFGLVIESETRRALQHCYAEANAMFLRNYRLRSQTTQSSSPSGANRGGGSCSSNTTITAPAEQTIKSGGNAASTVTPAVPYLTNEKQRALLDISAIYSSPRSTYTPLHVALLGVVLDNGDQDDEGVDEGDAVDVDTEEARMSALNARLRKQTTCVTVLLNCLYDLLCVAPASNTRTLKSQRKAVSVHPPHSLTSHGREVALPEGDAQARKRSLASRELLVDALNLQSPPGETALILAVRRNNVAVAMRLLKLGAQPACMDRVTRLLSLELACANRCTPIAEALLQPHSLGDESGSAAGTSVYATSPVLLNHAGIATALCWCSINNMPAVMQRLLECDGIDAESGFEGSSPLHLAIAFGSEAAALTLLSGTRPRKTATLSACKGRSGGAEAPPTTLAVVATAGATKHVRLGASQRGAVKTLTSTPRPTAAVSAANRDKMPFMDVNMPHERTRCTPLHLACERGQLNVIRALLQSWHAELNISAAYTNYTPLLTAVVNGQEEAALRILEYSKDELRRGRPVLDLCAIDQHGNTALHLAASRGLALALEYMLVQFSEEEVTRLATLHSTLRTSPAYQTAICMVPMHAVNKQGKTALLVAVQYEQTETAELLVSILIDSAETREVGVAGAVFGGGGGPTLSISSADAAEAPRSAFAAAAALAPSSMASAPSQVGGPLIEGTCLVLHQAHKKHLDSVVQLMLSAPHSLFPCTDVFRESVRLYKQQQTDKRHPVMLLTNKSSNGDVHPAIASDESSDQALASTLNENVAQRSHAMSHDRGSFVRLLLTRAAGPTISPNDALRVLLRGFTLPELCLYLSDVAAESVALGVQRGTAMAHSELLIGYLQEHAGSVVGPTRAVVFCRDVWLCLQQWMFSEVSAERERVAASLCHRPQCSCANESTCSQLAPDMEKSGEHRQKKQPQSEFEVTPMNWLSRMLLVSKAAVRSGVRGTAAQPTLTSQVDAPSPCAVSVEGPSAAEEAEHYRNALEATLNRKTASLNMARMIRLYGRSHGGARAIEEIKSIVQAHVKTKVSAPAAVAPSATLNDTGNSFSHSALPRSVKAQSMRDLVEQGAAWNRDSGADFEATMATRGEHPSHNSIDVSGNEAFFTTPMGFTVLQLAATLNLPELAAFLVETYNLDPLYAPAQGMYTYVARPAAPPPPRQQQQQANRSNQGSKKAEEAARVRDVVAHTVRAMIGMGPPCPGRGDYGGASKSREDDAVWFCWTPYRLAVRSGNTHTVKRLLVAGSDATSATAATAEMTFREQCDTRASARLSHSGEYVEDSVSAGSAGVARMTETSPAAALVDYKEPAWLDPYERTALQERIVAAITCGSGASGSDSLVASDTLTASAGSSASGAATATSPTLSETLAMVHLLLRHGAQTNGLFDSTGSDAWLLAVAGSGAADLPVTHNSYVAKCKGAGSDKDRPYSAGSQASFSLLSPREASLRSVRTSAGGSAGQRCIDLLLRFRAPLLGCAPASQHRPGTLLDGRRLAGPQASAETQCFNQQLLRHPHYLLCQWRRLPCMRLAPTGRASTRSAHGVRRAAGTGGNAHDDNHSDETHDTAGMEGVGAAAGHDCTVFDQADALCAWYEVQQQQLLYPSTVIATPRSVGGAESCSPPPQASTQFMAGSSTSFLTFTSVERIAGLPRAATQGGAVKLDHQALTAGYTLRADNLAGRETETLPLTPSVSVESVKRQLIAALRLCYRVVLLYTCVEYTPVQLLRLVGAFGVTAIPVSARHPLSGDSAATRLLRKARDRLLAGRSGNGGGATTSSIPRGARGSAYASMIVRGTDASSVLPLSMLNKPPCTGGPAVDPEARLLIDTCVALVHMLCDGVQRLPSSPSVPQLQAASAPTTAAGHALRSVLFRPSCDGETALSLAAQIAHAPLISILVQSGAAASLTSHDHSRNEDELWHSSHGPCSMLQGGDDSGTEARGEDGIGVYDLPEVPIPSNYSLRTNLEDGVVRVLLATRVYYPAHEIGTIRVMLTHMPNEPARRAFLRWVYPNVHPLPALQLAMDNVDVASDFLTTPDCMNALWTNLLYAHFTGQLDTAVRATAKMWNELLRVVLPGAPAVPIYLVMRAAVCGEVSAEELKASHTSVNAQCSQAVLSLLPQKQSRASSMRSLSVERKRAGARPVASTMSNWSHVVRLTNLFLQLMSMSVAETLMSKSNRPSSSLHELHKKGSVAALMDGTQSPSHGLSGTLLWDTIELAVRYDDKDVLQHLLQPCLPDVVLKHITNTQYQQHALSSTGTLGRTYSSMGVSAHAMEVVSTKILNSYPSFAGVSTTSQATRVLERLQRLLWREALQEHHVDLLAVAAGSVATLRFLYTSSPPEVRAQMTPMRYDRVDVKSGMPEGVSHAPDIVAPAAAATEAAEELMRTLQKAKKDSFSFGAISTTLSSNGEAWSAAPALATPTSPVSPAATQASTSRVVKMVETPDKRSSTLSRIDAPQLQLKTSKDNDEKENAAAVADAELCFMESCVRNGRHRLAPGEERRRRVAAVMWGLGADACAVKLPMVQCTVRAVSSASADTSDAATAPSTRVGVQLHRKPAPPRPLLPPALHRATGNDPISSANATFPDRATRNTKLGDVDPGKESCTSIPIADTTTTRRAVQRRGRAKTSLYIKASAAGKETGGQSPLSPTPPPAVVTPEPTYFMYLQLDWALHSTRLLRSPRPSSATLETIMFLLDQRVALSVPVLDLFLAGTVAPSNAAPVVPQQYSRKADAQQEITLNLHYQTREHQDTLLHLLVLHDQCQLAEYYLEYCHFWFVSNELDPEPVSGRPGRFPIDQHAASAACNSSEDDLGDGDGCYLGSGGSCIDPDGEKRSTRLSHELRRHSRLSSSSSSGYVRTVPRKFLRCMLRVNAHGLTAFDYAYTPTMLQVLEWYGCVAPTYRPNPHVFRRVIFSQQEGGRGGHGDVREAYTLADNVDDYDSDEAANHQRKSGRGMTMRRKREVLRFFPVPRLVLATDSFVELLDPTGTELASTAGSVATALARTTASGTTDGQSHKYAGAVDGNLTKDDVLMPTRAQQQQQPSDHYVAAMISTERRQLQVSRRRRQQQEHARALLFEQVSAQSQTSVAHGGGNNSEADKGTRGGRLLYLMRAVTAHWRQQWELQRHPPCSEMALYHNALEAQRLPASAFTTAPSRGRRKLRNKSGACGSVGAGAGVLPILLSEEVSLLHLALCSFEDELVRLYGELQTASVPAAAAGNDNSGAARAHRTGGTEVATIGDSDDNASGLSAYSRLLLPLSVTGKPATQQQQQQDHEGGKWRSGSTPGGTPPEMGNPKTTPEPARSRTSTVVLPRAPALGGSMGAALLPGQQGRQLASASPVNDPVAASQDWGSCRRAPTSPPRLSHMDVVFLLECQRFIVYPLSLPSTDNAVGILHNDNGGDDTHDENSKPRSSARGNGERSASIGNTGCSPSNDGRSVTSPRMSLGKGSDAVGELPAVIKRCTGGYVGINEQLTKAMSSDAPHQRASPALTVRDTPGRCPAPPHRSSARRERGGSARGAPPSDLPLLRSLLARKASDDLSSALVDTSDHRCDAALLVSLTPMILSGIGSGGAGGTPVSAAATMRGLAVQLMDTRWKQFGNRPVISDANTDAALTATDVVALLNVPPFIPVDSPVLQSCQASLPTAAAPERGGLGTSTAALGSDTARTPTVMAARLEEWVARRWPLPERAPRSSKLHGAGSRADKKYWGLPLTNAVTAHKQEDEKERIQNTKDTDDDGYDDDEAAKPSVLDQIKPVGGVATAAQQFLMRALLKRFTAATGAQLSEQMGFLITPNYDVVEVGDTAAALRGTEAEAAAPQAVQTNHRWETIRKR
nr:unnamed protein product [Leishmania braziliensis]